MPAPLVRFLGGLAWGQPTGCRNLAWVPVFGAPDHGCGDPSAPAEHGGPRWSRAMRVGTGHSKAGRSSGRDPASLEHLLDAFPAAPGQTGFIALVDGAVAGCELLGHPADFERLRPALLRRYALTAGEAVDSAAERFADLRDQDMRLARLAASFRQRADRVAEAYRAAVAEGRGSAGAARVLYEELRTLEAGVELFARQRRILREELELLAADSAADRDDEVRDPVLWWSRVRVFVSRAMERVASVPMGAGRRPTQRFSAGGLRGTVRFDGDEVVGLSLQVRQASRRRRGLH